MNLARIKTKRIMELKNNVRLYIAQYYDWQAIRQIAEGTAISQAAKNRRFHALKICSEKETKINAATNILEVMAVKIDL